MIDVHGRCAIEGCHPNTYTNILWCFGLPERPIFGKIRYISLDSVKRKTGARAYIDEINGQTAPQQQQQLLWIS